MIFSLVLGPSWLHQEEAKVDDTVYQSAEERQEARELSQQVAPADLEGYELDTLLGEGTFGSVWSGTQTRTGQKVAVKLLRTDTINFPYFQHELKKLVQVAEHPHVVTLIDADPEHDPPFYVMPKLSRSLADIESRPPLKRSLEWLEQIAQALRYMHGKGLLHCDLKPSNVLLDQQDRPCLVDFGQCRGLEEAGALGTLGYMAPEQAEPGALPDARWDIYAFGATAYFILTGLCPRLTPEDQTNLTLTDDLDARLDIYRKLLQERDLVKISRLHPEVDSDMVDIIEWCLQPDPAKRPFSMQQVLEDFQRRERGQPLLCHRPWSGRYRLNRFVRRPVVAVTLFLAIMFPMFLNTYLSTRAQWAIRDLVQRGVQQNNSLAVSLLKAEMKHRPELTPQEAAEHLRTYASIESVVHLVLTPDGKILAATGPAPEQIDLAAIEQVHSDRGMFEVAGAQWVGSWRRAGPWVIMSQRDRDQAMSAFDDILQKNRLFNIMILAVAVLTTVILSRIQK